MLRSLLLAATLLTPLPALSQGIAGPYLAARIAGFSNDYSAAGQYYRDLLAQGEDDARILENAMIIYSVLGDFNAATAVADTLDATGESSQFSASGRMVKALSDERWDDAAALLDEGSIAGPLLDGLLTAWIAAAQGRTSDALAAFDTLGQTEAFAPFAYLHKAYALASVGDYEGADDILSGRAYGALNATTRGVAAHAQILVQLDQRDAAAELLQKANDATSSALLRDLEARITAGETIAYDIVATPLQGMAEAYFVFAALLASDSSTTFTLINARAAISLRPDHVEALVMTAELLENQNQHKLAADVLAGVPRDDPAFYEAEISRAEILLASDQNEAALEVLAALTRSDADKIEVWAAYADALRRLERFAPAAKAYDRAIAMLSEVTPRNWLLFYTRGIARERLSDWTGAEADFRQALTLNPENPNVLNYLGYGLVEQRIKLDEALGMIERAVAARPNDGFITDSLAWVLYRLGRYDEAVAPMERAVQLEPLDPLINDHLGDVLWSVGRKREARFQWKRALSLDPQEQVERIRRKLDVGLDVVLEEEGGVGPIKTSDK
ncbi:tetratricopeptide repeat protein [Jannaschia helgolandensis]|uniref:tetratricopeptide repeat protein n=1 Tax=Jannaschia helgolandensis TaxID=188906 RepID=UPI0030D7C94D|tara:strand:+ start:255 stop:1934 length:1680 start_codon:yes stop_codon:yes gene_type:complete